MKDGVTGSVSLTPADGERLRGSAAGLGFGEEDVAGLDELTRAQLLQARRTGEVGLVHSWETVTAVDGPGTRLTFFLSGCPLRCLYCHNPDTLEMKEGTLERADDLVARIRRMRPVFRASHGGITLSGGEALFQPAFATRIFREAHAMGVHTCLDTSGFLGARLSDEDLAAIDLVLLDVKSGDEGTHRRVTSQPLQPTIDFGDRLAALGKKVWARFVLVPGLTDSDENIENVADIVARWRGNVERVEVLPFHNMAIDKWDALGLDYQLRDTPPPTRESIQRAVGIFESRGLTTYHG